MSVTTRDPAPRSGTGGAGARFPALLWALLHVPLFLALYRTPIEAAVRATPARWRAFLWPTFLPQAGLIALIAFLIALPFSFSRRAYRWAAPAAAGLVTVAVGLDSRLYGSLGYHLNGFFFKLMMQPNALREAGVPLSDVAILAAAAVAFLALDVALGARFVARFSLGRRAWPLALGLALLATAERFYGGAMVYFGGPAFFAASTVLPAQVPIRIDNTVAHLVGKPKTDPFARTDELAVRLPAGVAPEEIHFTRKPDVLFLVAESLPSEHLDARTMPNLWRRSEAGARFPHHYAGASSTNYTLFTLLYGVQASKLEATVGAGRQPVLFPALRANGYQMRLLSASCVDWMGLKETVFGGVHDDLETWCDGEYDRDPKMIASAEKFVEKADPQKPLFMFLFFFGTHFNYTVDAQDQVFTPAWDGVGGLKATETPAPLIQNRARNAAHTLDRRLEAFLSWFEAKRGRAPLVFFTGDHGEEFRQKGHIGHGSHVTREQVNVPGVWLGPGVPVGAQETPTSHADVVPTIFSLLGDVHPPSLYADGQDVFTAPADRFVVTTVGWEPRYAVVGRDLKVQMYAGLGTADVTDPDDRPLPDGAARLARNAGKIMRALRGEDTVTTSAGAR
jgi:membrane-anchored protein YejM (alkaline phosphatase superfamily)